MIITEESLPDLSAVLRSVGGEELEFLLREDRFKIYRSETEFIEFALDHPILQSSYALQHYVKHHFPDLPPDTVAKFEPVVVGEGYRFDPDEILEAAKGQDFESLVIIGQLPDGETWVSSSANAGVALVLIHRAINQIVQKP